MWILTCIAIVFTLSWLPLTILTIVIEFEAYSFKSTELMYSLFVLCHILAMSSAGTNPLLYGYLNTNFRRDLTCIYYSICHIRPSQRTSSRRKRIGSQVNEEKPQRDGKSTNATEPLSIVVKSRDRRTSSSFGTTLTTTFRTRSSSCGVTQKPKIEEL